MTSEGSERAKRREECEEHVDDDEFRQQMRELIGEVEEQINREEVEGSVESGDADEERDAEAKRESTDIDEESGGDDEFRREMQELIAEVREISERDESEESDEFRKQMRELIGEVERELEADERSSDSAEDRLDEFEEDILENFEKYGIDGDEVRERWRERFVEDVEEELEKDITSDELDESTKASDDAADSEMTETAESHSYSESSDGTVQVLKTEGSSESTESVDKSEEHKAEMEPQSEADLSVEGEKDRAVEECNQKEDLESSKAEKHPEKQITHETETSEHSTQHELNRNSKERSPETSENAQARQQTSETVLESSEEIAEAAERKEAQVESIETHSPRAECEELAEEEVEDTQTEGHLNESDEEEGEVTQDSDSKSMQEWKEDGESEELADFEHLEEPDSTQSTLESYQEVLEENISPNAEELDEDEEVDERAVSDDEGLTGMLDSPYPTVYVDETGFFAENEEQRWRRKLIELYNELPEEMKQLYREIVKAMLESEEGLEKLLDTFSELREYEDFEEEHVDAIKYVKFRQKIRELELLGTQEETTVKELALEVDIDKETAEKWLNDDYDSFPKIIQQVWKQEIERRWGNVLRAIANRDVPYDMSEINEILKRFPELKRKRRFGWHYDEVKAWTEVMAAKRRGRIATLIIQGKERFKIDEVKELAKRFNLTMGKVVRWLRDEDRPRLVDVLTEKNEFMKECIERGVTAQDVEKRNKNIQECNAKHPFRRTDSETDEEATTTQDDISPSRNESPVAQTHDTESKGTVSEVGEITEMFSWLKHENQLLLAAILSEKGQDLETWRGHKGLAYFRQLVHLQTEHILVLADQIASTSLEGTKHSPRNCRGKIRTLWTNAFDESAKGFLQEPFELESHNRDYIVEKIRAKGPSGVEEFSHTWKYDFLSRLSQLREELEPKITFSQITLWVRNIDRVLRYGFRKAESARLLFELLRARSNMAFEATLRGGTEASTLARRGNTYYLLSQLIGVWQASCVLSTSKELDLNGLSASSFDEAIIDALLETSEKIEDLKASEEIWVGGEILQICTSDGRVAIHDDLMDVLNYSATKGSKRKWSRVPSDEEASSPEDAGVESRKLLETEFNKLLVHTQMAAQLDLLVKLLMGDLRNFAILTIPGWGSVTAGVVTDIIGNDRLETYVTRSGGFPQHFSPFGFVDEPVAIVFTKEGTSDGVFSIDMYKMKTQLFRMLISGKSMNKALEHSKSMMLDTNDAWSLDDHEVLYHLQFCRGEDAKRAGPKPGFGMVPLLKSLFQLEATWEKQQKHYSKKFPNKPTERRRWRRGRVWDDITGVALALAKRTLKDNGEDSQGVSKLIIRGLRDSSSPITSILESLSYIATELRIKSNKIVWHSSPIPMNLENQAHADVSDGRDHQIILSEGEPTNVQDLLIQREKMLFEETLRVVGCLDRDTTVKVAGLVNPLLTSYRYLSEMLIRCLSDHKQFGLNVRGQIKYSGARSIYEAFSQGCYVFFRALGLGIPLRSNTWEGLHTLGHLKHTKQYKIGKKACYEYEWTDCIKSPDVLRSRLVFKLSEIFNRFTSKRIGKVAFRTDQYNIEYYEDIKLAHLKRKRTRSTDQWEGVPGSIRRGFIITGETLQGDRVPVYPIPLFIEYKEGSTFYQGTHPDILLSREKICRHLKSSPLALEKAKQFFGKINELNTEYFDSETVHERFREIERQLGDQFKALFKLVSKHHIALDSVIDRAKTRQILAMLRMVTGQSWMTQHGTTADTGLEQVERASVLSHVNGLGFPISIANSYLTMPSEFWCSAIGPAADLMTSELLDSFARHCDMSDDYEVENYMLAVGPTSGQGTQADTILGFADDSISQIVGISLKTSKLNDIVDKYKRTRAVSQLDTNSESRGLRPNWKKNGGLVRDVADKGLYGIHSVQGSVNGKRFHLRTSLRPRRGTAERKTRDILAVEILANTYKAIHRATIFLEKSSRPGSKRIRLSSDLSQASERIRETLERFVAANPTPDLDKRVRQMLYFQSDRTKKCLGADCVSFTPHHLASVLVSLDLDMDGAMQAVKRLLEENNRTPADS